MLALTIKRCNCCQHDKVLADFPRNKNMADGYLNTCKTCRQRQCAQWRRENPSRTKEYDRNRAATAERRRQVQAARDRWAQRYPERKAAEAVVTDAIRKGQLTPWPACATPGCDNGPLEAHHCDYTRPLDVVWLCQCCHKQAHQLARILSRSSATISYA